MRHELKILPQHFTPVLDEIKTAELRKNDRNFAAGDTLILMEWNGDFTGDACERVITHVADVGDYLPGYVLLSMAPPKPQPSTTPQIDNDGWVDWSGGEMPTSSDCIVEVKFRDVDCQMAQEAFDFDWHHYGNASDIIAYRVIENEGREG